MIAFEDEGRGRRGLSFSAGISLSGDIITPRPRRGHRRPGMMRSMGGIDHAMMPAFATVLA